MPDPFPSPRPSTKQRFLRIFRLLALLSLVVAAIAMVLVQRGDPELHIHMLIATGVGVALTMLLGTALMTLAFLSSSSGHDDQATRRPSNKDEQE